MKVKKKTILKEVSGVAEPGRLVAVMGPSGSGKTSLLSAIAGRLEDCELKGQVLIDGKVYEEGARGLGAFVKQKDLFYPYATVRETLEFHARLRRGDKRIDEALTKTGLSKVADSMVKGISGGEKKRLAIACELIADPELCFLDEPTSGLDSYAAERVAKVLRALADEGKTIICVVHQPSSLVFDLFDDLVLLSEGQVMYSGPIHNLDWHFQALGLPRDKSASRAEHAVACVSIDFEDEKESRKRVQHIAQRALRLEPKEAPKGKSKANSRKAPLKEQLWLLQKRAFKDVTRAKTANSIKAVQQLMTALIYGSIYSLDDSPQSIQDRFGLLSLAVIGSTNLAVASAIRTFPVEKQIVTDERQKNMYSALPYLVSKILAEAPVVGILSGLFSIVVYPLAGLQRTTRKFFTFLGVQALNTVASSALGLLIGAVAPSTDAALAIFPAVIVLSVVFNGANIADKSTPKLLRWLPKLSLCRWAFQACAVNEFKGLKFKPRNMNGADALDRLNMKDATIQKAVTAQALILGGCYLQTYRTLNNAKPNYANFKPPKIVPPVPNGGATSRRWRFF